MDFSSLYDGVGASPTLTPQTQMTDVGETRGRGVGAHKPPNISNNTTENSNKMFSWFGSFLKP